MRPRYTAFDGLRILCFATIIFWHALLPFTNRPRGLKADLTSEWADLALWLVRGLALKELFLIAGFFAHASLERRGARDYLKYRLRRLGLPFFTAWAFYNWLFLYQVGGVLGQTPWRYAETLIGSGNWYEVVSARHLWFLVDLAFLTVIVVVLRELTERMLPRNLSDRAQSFLGKVLGSPLCPFLLALPTGLLIWLHDPTYPSSNLTQFAALPFYPLITMLGFHAIFFLVGWALHSHPQVLEAWSRRWALHLGFGLCLRWLYYYLVLVGPHRAWSVPLVHILDALGAWGVVLGFLGLFQRKMVTDRALWRYLADGAFWFYLAHFLFLEQTQLWLLGRGWPWPVQYGVVVAVTLSGLLLSYEFLIRYTFLGRALHGPRQVPEGGRWAALSWSSS